MNLAEPEAFGSNHVLDDRVKHATGQNTGNRPCAPGLFGILCIWSGPCGYQIWSRIEAALEHDSELVSGCKPSPDIAAAFLEVADCQADQLRRRFLGRERPTRLD